MLMASTMQWRGGHSLRRPTIHDIDIGPKQEKAKDHLRLKRLGLDQ